MGGGHIAFMQYWIGLIWWGYCIALAWYGGGRALEGVMVRQCMEMQMMHVVAQRDIKSGSRRLVHNHSRPSVEVYAPCVSHVHPPLEMRGYERALCPCWRVVTAAISPNYMRCVKAGVGNVMHAMCALRFGMITITIKLSICISLQ